MQVSVMTDDIGKDTTALHGKGVRVRASNKFSFFCQEWCI